MEYDGTEWRAYGQPHGDNGVTLMYTWQRLTDANQASYIAADTATTTQISIGMRFAAYGDTPSQFPFKGHLRNFKVTSCQRRPAAVAAAVGTAAEHLSPAAPAPDLTATGNGVAWLRCTCSTPTI